MACEVRDWHGGCEWGWPGRLRAEAVAAWTFGMVCPALKRMLHAVDTTQKRGVAQNEALGSRLACKGSLIDRQGREQGSCDWR